MPDRAGINVLDDSDETAARSIADWVRRDKRPEDLVVCSIHWGANWGFDIPPEQQHLAHELIDVAGVDVVYGHSSHHPKAIEVYNGKAVFYGCGDFINDYEGIRPAEGYRDDLTLMYLIDLNAAGRLESLQMIPFRIRNFSLHLPSSDDVAWLRTTMDRECRRFGGSVAGGADCLTLTTVTRVARETSGR
jgi:poly-gamma-glutamate synthesis protein (capsule biosynthesis protein)